MDEEAGQILRAFFTSVEEGLRLLESEPELIEARTGLGETPLHYLAVENHLDAVRALVERGAEVNTLNECGGTPLSEAASLGYVALVRYLLSVGVKLRVEGQEESVLHEGVRSGNVEMVKLLIEAGADVNAVDGILETPLHIAAEQDKNIEIVRLLITAGANIDAKRIFDQTPLTLAKENGADKVVEELVRLGAS